MYTSENLINTIGLICIPESREEVKLTIENEHTLVYSHSEDCNVFFKNTDKVAMLGLTSNISIDNDGIITISDLREDIDIGYPNFYETKGVYPLEIIDRIEIA
jgi:hypothetical protein